MTETMKSVLVAAALFVAFAFIAGMVIGTHYGSEHPTTTDSHSKVGHKHPTTWDPHFKVCHTHHDHKCLWIQGKAWWVK